MSAPTITQLQMRPKCPVCRFQFSPERERTAYHIVKVIDGFPVNVPVCPECKANIGTLDPNIYPVAGYWNR